MFEFFIRRPIFAAVLSILIVLAGAITLPTLPIAQYPQIALPQITVTSVYTGASAEVVESAVTIPLEQAINGVEGMKYISSTSSSDGTSQIVVTFDVARNVDIAAVDVQNRVSTAQARLPNEVKQTGVTVTKSGASFVLAVALFSEHGEYDQKFISNHADVYLREAIKRVQGVAEVRIFGERKFAMRVWLDPDKLAQRGLSATDVIAAISEQNAQVPAGQLGRPPQAPEQEFQITLQVAGRLAEEREFERVVLAANPDGSVVQLGDVGRAELGAEDYSTSLRFNGRRAVGLGVLQLSTANALDVRNGALETIERLSQSFPPGLKWVDAFDTTLAVSSSVDEVVVTLLEAIALVVLVIFVFLQSLRSTLIPAIAIPVSLIGTFAFVKLFGFTINTLTLFGLTLATGLVVDDAIVVIENVQRHIDEEKISAREGAPRAMREVGGAVIATSLVLMAVFAPPAFLPGTTGRIYQQFSLTIAFAVALSLFNSLTLTPALSALLLRAAPERKNAFFRGFDRVWDRARRGYLAALAWTLRRRALTLAAYALVIGGAAFLFYKVPRGFLPEEDQGWFIVQTQGPSGVSLAYTERAVEETDEVFARFPEIENVFQVAGFSFAGAGPNRAITFVALKPWGERTRTAQEIISDLRGALAANERAIMLPFAPPAIAGVGTFGGFEFELEDRASQSLDELAGAVQATVQRASEDPGLLGVFTGFTADDPQLYVTVDRVRAKELGLGHVFQTMQVYFGSSYVNDFTFANRSYRVYVQAESRRRDAPSDLAAPYARSRRPAQGSTATGLPTPGRDAAGTMVPLGGLLDVKPRTTAAQISHYNLFRAAEINGIPAIGRSAGQAMVTMERVARATRPPGFAYEWSGIALEQMEAGRASARVLARARARVPGARGAVRERGLAADRALRGAARDLRRAPWCARAHVDQRRLHPDRPRAARGPLGQERDPHRRVREPAPRAGSKHHGRRDGGLARALAAHHDDLAHVHPRRHPADVRARLGRRGAPLDGHHRLRRHGGLHLGQPVLRTRALRDDRGAPRARAPEA